MTKETYFDMCRQLNSEPIESEIPFEYEDLMPEIQYALSIYLRLKDEWDTMNGNYMGKNYSGIADIFTILEVPREDWKITFDLIGIIDKHRTDSMRKEKDKVLEKAKNPAK